MEVSFQHILDSQAYADKKAELAREINSKKLVIDRSVFKKTDAEKGKLITLKKKLPKTRNYKFKTYSKVAI